MNFPLLHAERFGSQRTPPVLLLHGFLGSLNDWDQVIRLLNQDVDFLAIDLPGHGASRYIGLDYDFDRTAAEIIKILDDQGVATCPLAGYSMGGRIALYTAVKFPQRFSHLVLESCTAGVRESQERQYRLKFEHELCQKLSSMSMPEFINDWYNAGLFDSLRQHARFNELVEARRRNDPASLSRVVHNLGSGHMPSLWHPMQHLHMPIHFIYGERDDTYKSIAAHMVRQAKNGSLYEICNSGHNTHFENPEEFCNVIKKVLLKKE
ncbi:2-succinyl-6-hydroxy-2,4-cyclohexadiene-1-carboxylate synthase [candidate division KSB1 bacterium]|nr:2-succinyl-6-hydroxy-2,4-cyclohexadiene-1-carboxylate synthase [candidate division KSB1 bacterium]RQW04196.1 MAG: 2-succinyl-6-hydroxy-2,4-cyclohexadiene-1-carboxylate synthase [candidate division KSB1 bacterium]